MAVLRVRDGVQLRMRSEPSLDADILQVLEPGTVVDCYAATVRADGYTWYRSRLGDGWMAGDFLQLHTAPSPGEVFIPGQTAVEAAPEALASNWLATWVEVAGILPEPVRFGIDVIQEGRKHSLVVRYTPGEIYVSAPKA